MMTPVTWHYFCLHEAVQLADGTILSTTLLPKVTSELVYNSGGVHWKGTDWIAVRHLESEALFFACIIYLYNKKRPF